MWGKQQAKDEDVGVPSSETEHTDLVPQSSNTEMHPFKNQQHVCPESFIHLVFLPRNELGINSTFYKLKILVKFINSKERNFFRSL